MNFTGALAGVRESAGIGLASGALLSAGKASPQSIGINTTLQDQILSKSDLTLARRCRIALVSSPYCANQAR